MALEKLNRALKHCEGFGFLRLQLRDWGVWVGENLDLEVTVELKALCYIGKGSSKARNEITFTP